MAASSCRITSFPAEIVVRVFQHCSSLADVRALALACRYTHAVWVANNPSILRPFTITIPAFDQALLAVRMDRCQP